MFPKKQTNKNVIIVFSLVSFHYWHVSATHWQWLCVPLEGPAAQFENHCIRPSFDWLSLTNRRFEQEVGGASHSWEHNLLQMLILCLNNDLCKKIGIGKFI